MKSCKFHVSYTSTAGTQSEARFTDYNDAMTFARLQRYAEVASTRGAGRGLIGQFEAGTPTPEFAHLDD